MGFKINYWVRIIKGRRWMVLGGLSDPPCYVQLCVLFPIVLLGDFFSSSILIHFIIIFLSKINK